MHENKDTKFAKQRTANKNPKTQQPALPIIKRSKDLAEALQQAAIKQSWPEWWPE
ncbi:unnamed protein product [Fructobacillus fructosus]|uniref:Uncharacterized protein n=1 Tax=Fructobacillus fructosus TaxID=1631 RepID=A0ABN9YX67_9LACO|nr:unnamed protein product [Fructobacillus fructosus]CAK1251655.1 unnamed protein product [Fructobacillus fructosus]